MIPPAGTTQPQAIVPRAAARAAHRPVVQVFLVLIACAAIYWPHLGRAGFSGTEGHRAIPAYHMLDSGDWLVPRLFGRPYLRKPPGMPWAIAATSSVLGRTEFAARSVSATAATLSALVALWFGRRWFGALGGLYAGLTQVLMPIFWSPARSADIEALMNLGVQLACFAIIDLSIAPRADRARRGLFMGLLIATGLIIAGLSKGPPGATVVAACLLGAAIVQRSILAVFRPALVAGLVLGVASVGAVFWLIAQRAADAGPSPVTQAVDEFLWQQGKTLQVLLLAPSSLVMALPGSLALLFPWGPDAFTESNDQLAREHPAAFPVARALSFAVLISLGILTIAGVSNPRYAMPTQMLIAPVAGYFGLGMQGLFILKRPPIARACVLGHPLVMCVGLLAAGIAMVFVGESRRFRVAGRQAGELIARSIPPGSVIWADHLVEARPDVLWYASTAAGTLGVRVEWRPLAQFPELPDANVSLVLRDDDDAGDLKKYEEKGILSQLREVARGNVYQYSFRVLSRPPEGP